jgi:hypothetical protein
MYSAGGPSLLECSRGVGEPPVGATRAAEELAERTGLPIDGWDPSGHFVNTLFSDPTWFTNALNTVENVTDPQISYPTGDPLLQCAGYFTLGEQPLCTQVALRQISLPGADSDAWEPL